MSDADKSPTWDEQVAKLEAVWAEGEDKTIDNPRAYIAKILKKHNLSTDAINKRYLPDLMEVVEREGITSSKRLAEITFRELKAREEERELKRKPDPDNLEDWFPRGDKMPTPNPTPAQTVDPDGETPIRPAAHWSQDEVKTAMFWKSAEKVHTTRNIQTPIRPALEAFMLETYGSASLAGIPMGMKGAELLAKYGEYLDYQISKEIADPNHKAPDAPPPPKPIVLAPPKPTPNLSSAPRPKDVPYTPMSTDEVRRKYTVDLKGKQYLQVSGRILLFRANHPIDMGWAIKTTIMNATDTAVVFLAEIANPEGIVVASGHGRAVASQAGNYGGRIFEKAETAAIGRALANAGYGTDEVDETESPDHLADSPIPAY